MAADWDSFTEVDRRRAQSVFVQTDVEREILRLSGLCEENVHTIAERAEAAAHADATYKREHAKALLKAEAKTVGDREALAAIATDEDYTARKITEARLLAAQEASRAYRAQLDALRSINANMRGLV